MDMTNHQNLCGAHHKSKTNRHNGSLGRPPDRSPAAQAELAAMLAAAKERARKIEQRQCC
jgi:hypothetical protein